MSSRTEVCIVGAGPAGATLSHFLSKSKISHVLVDKASFPRDKVCGDGITVDVMHTLKRLDPELLQDFIKDAQMLPSWGFCFHSPGGFELRHDFKDDDLPYAPFFTSRRQDLDNFLVARLGNAYCEFMPGHKVVGITDHGDEMEVSLKSDTGEKSVRCKIVIGAEGEKPIVSRYLGLDHYRAKEHLIGALRVYYKGVKGFHTNNHLEFFFDKRLLPGYFWAFPLSENEANVGLGMVSTAISKRKANLKSLLDEMIRTHPRIAEMFRDAEPLEKPVGWGLPTISPRRRIAGQRYALVGDAAGMIEPFTGKGIGPGMVSARILSEHIQEALTLGNHDLSSYQDHMYRYYKTETRTGYALQRSLKNKAILAAVMRITGSEPFKAWSHSKMSNAWGGWM